MNRERHADAGDAEGPAGDLIRAEIASRGPIPFSRFMELALYAPGVGYYRAPDRPIGRSGDFYTSVSVGPVLGFLLAWRFAGWFRGGEAIDLVEVAAHDGRLVDDVLGAWQRFHPAVFERVRSWIVEPFPDRETVQRRRLARWEDRLRWIRGLEALPGPISGVVFANELLDAFPVRRWGWDARERGWFEWGVTVTVTVTVAGGGRFEWCRLPSGTGPDLEALPAELAEVIPDGFVLESCPAAEAWWRTAARVLRPGTGWLATLDYGFDRESSLRPERPRGSLRAYHRHRLVEDLLTRPGGQDLTAHVDFGRVARAGEAEGLRTETRLPQGRWLGAVAAEVFSGGGPAAAWLREQSRGLQTLMDPRHLGGVFHALVQRREGTVVATGAVG